MRNISSPHRSQSVLASWRVVGGRGADSEGGGGSGMAALYGAPRVLEVLGVLEVLEDLQDLQQPSRCIV
jgi:hypothetical protein